MMISPAAKGADEEGVRDSGAGREVVCASGDVRRWCRMGAGAKRDSTHFFANFNRRYSGNSGCCSGIVWPDDWISATAAVMPQGYC